VDVPWRRAASETRENGGEAANGRGQWNGENAELKFRV
jgi:hypothetical protein